ncbi:MAG: hypothetical protein WBB28_01940 [Crinalium sp.]
MDWNNNCPVELDREFVIKQEKFFRIKAATRLGDWSRPRNIKGLELYVEDVRPGEEDAYGLQVLMEMHYTWLHTEQCYCGSVELLYGTGSIQGEKPYIEFLGFLPYSIFSKQMFFGATLEELATSLLRTD